MTTKLFAGDPEAKPSTTEIKVAVYQAPPFVFKEKGKLRGFDIDLVKWISKQNNWKPKFQMVESFTDLIPSLEANSDIAITNMTINKKREEIVDFSHPYLTSGLGILIGNEDEVDKGSRFLIAYGDLAFRIAKTFGLLILVIIAMGTMLWLMDRGSKNAGIPDDPKKGIPAGIWCAFATASTVGYGDVTPHRWSGKLSAMVIFVVGTLVIGSVVGMIASEAVEQKLLTGISGPKDLKGKAVGVIAGSTAVEASKRVGAQIVEFENIDKAFIALLNKDLSAIVYDEPRLNYYTSKNGKGKVHLAEHSFASQNYGIALKHRSELIERINQGILEAQETGVINDLKNKYFPK